MHQFDRRSYIDILRKQRDAEVLCWNYGQILHQHFRKMLIKTWPIIEAATHTTPERKDG